MPDKTRDFSFRAGKRVADVALASAALVLGAPLAAAVALAIYLNSAGPVLFSQVRVGRNGKHFVLYKFRTLPWDPGASAGDETRWMDVAPHEAGALGRWLRRGGLDEWPQFWNVLRGEMSVVGPRPERPHFTAKFNGTIEGYSRRLVTKPGITGWAQIHGLRGRCDIADRLRLDLEYLDNWSLWLDCRILLRTPLHSLGGSPPPSRLPAKRPGAPVNDHAGSI